MSRSRFGRHALQDRERSILGSHFSTAMSALNNMNDRMARAAVPFEYTQDEVMSWLFPSDVLDKLRAAFPYTKAADRYVSYSVGGASLMLSYVDQKILPPQQMALAFNTHTVTPLLKTIRDHNEVYEKFAVIQHVIAWLDKNATVGAIRYYFPSILALVPEWAELQKASLSRYVEPQGISEILPLIREASATIASGLMISKDLVVDNRGMTLTVGQEQFTRHGVHLILPMHAYYL